jgi:cytochrome P450
MANPVSTLPDAPGPRGLASIATTLTFLRSTGLPFDYVRQVVSEYGDIVRLPIGGKIMNLVCHPDLIQEVLVKRVQEFHKPNALSGDKRGLGHFLGAGILTADHEPWRPQRKLIQPLMHAKQIENYANTMTRLGENLIQGWQNGSRRDLHHDMTQVTMEIIAETMFGTTMESADRAHEAVKIGQAITIAEFTQPLALPWMAQKKAQDIISVNKDLDSIVQYLLEDRRAHPDVERDDLMTLLMNTTDENGNPVSFDFVRNNILTLFVAGHETTANSLTWAFYYLAKNPHIADKMYEELDSVLAGRAATLADLPNLPYTLMVLKEAMRIEPAVSAFPRALIEDTELGGYRLEKNSTVFIPTYQVHHDERWWSNPFEFQPERFTPEEEGKRHKYAYMPFGGGPRVCIGNHFAMMEGHILLATIASQFKLTLANDEPVQPVRLITTFPKHKLMMTVQQREPVKVLA